jgi:hypothetical protein
MPKYRSGSSLGFMLLHQHIVNAWLKQKDSSKFQKCGPGSILGTTYWFMLTQKNNSEQATSNQKLDLENVRD